MSFSHSLRLSSLDRKLTIILANHHWYFECTNDLPIMRREIPYLALTEVQSSSKPPVHLQAQYWSMTRTQTRTRDTFVDALNNYS